jgi:hypothetical protein
MPCSVVSHVTACSPERLHFMVGPQLLTHIYPPMEAISQIYLFPFASEMVAKMRSCGIFLIKEEFNEHG